MPSQQSTYAVLTLLREFLCFFNEAAVKPLLDKQQIVDSIARVAKHLGHTPSILEFAAHAEISRSSLFLLFPKWNDAVRAAGLKPNRLYVRPTGSELLKVIEAVQKEFPDCEAKRQIVPGRWQRVLYFIAVAND